MALRKEPLVNGEIYHIYNRGNGKRIIFKDEIDSWRFLRGIKEFNTNESVHFFKQFGKNNNCIKKGKTYQFVDSKGEPLVEIIAYSLNPNHFHLILKQIVDNGISTFMKKLLTGYVMYFNERHKETGSLFGGRFKSRLVKEQSDLLNLSIYVNLNSTVHNLDERNNKIIRSSIEEYRIYKLRGPSSQSLSLCKKEIILDHFEDGEDYYKQAKDRIVEIKRQRDEFKKSDNEV